jgi:hypothetical protein
MRVTEKSEFTQLIGLVRRELSIDRRCDKIHTARLAETWTGAPTSAPRPPGDGGGRVGTPSVGAC